MFLLSKSLLLFLRHTEKTKAQSEHSLDISLYNNNIVCMIWLDLNILASLKDLVMLICRPKLMRTATEQPQRRDTTYKANFKQDEDIHQQNCGDLMIMTDRYHEGSIDLIEIEIFLRVKGHIFEMKMMRSTLAC
ncbi:hypothetical protein RCL_jg28434.t1 [Rhizophagus clarus]|uniref:EF-hand domain-containing protein n=1 Tax=Rhizophagus clarus TaxID=94130 RepID=A0A8H3M660_9GLOM|nr:hypothetical protein RCL_jg28434.t1 [Rhizophagus clarus]